ncbi:MAG: hypothetical protein HYU88_11720 [Chloroflexi bacterium]|nr:hypothetical protein [Chloroflexota bacterium]
MPTEEHLPLAERLLRLLQHLGVARAHVAASWAQDYLGLLGAHPEVVASLILVCPRMDLDVGALAPVAPRLLLIHGDCGPQASVVPDVLPHLRGAAHVTLSGYADAVWADAIADRSDGWARWRAWPTASAGAGRRSCCCPSASLPRSGTRWRQGSPSGTAPSSLAAGTSVRWPSSKSGAARRAISACSAA